LSHESFKQQQLDLDNKIFTKIIKTVNYG